MLTQQFCGAPPASCQTRVIVVSSPSRQHKSNLARLALAYWAKYLPVKPLGKLCQINTTSPPPLPSPHTHIHTLSAGLGQTSGKRQRNSAVDRNWWVWVGEIPGEIPLYSTTVFICQHTHTHTYIHAHIHIYIHTHTRIHTYTHTHTHTHTHMHAQTHMHSPGDAQSAARDGPGGD